METIITAITSNRIVLAAAVVISILIVLSVARKLARIAVVLLAILVLYAAYLVYTGQRVPKTKEEIVKHGAKKIEEIKKNGPMTNR